MTQWTNSAKNSLNDYFARVSPHFAGSGADATEVMDDMRRHIDEEIAAAKLQVVTEGDVERILARIGAPEAGPRFPVPPNGSAPEKSDVKPARSKFITLLLFGTVLPLLTLGIELVTHMCAEVFFDPIPTIWHVLLVALVPVTNFLSWWAIRHGTAAWRGKLSIANGLALGISFFYALLYLPLAPFAVIAIIYLGWGLLPLSPLLGLMATWRLRVHLRRMTPEAQRLPGLWWGLGAAAIAVTLIALPPVATRYWSQMAVSESSETRADGIKWLRALGSRKTLLADCYGSTRWANDNPFGFNPQGKPVPPDEARTLFFRVTGEQFNAVPPPQRNYTRGGWEGLNEFTWDREQGGDAVAGRLAGLSLAQSRLDGLTDPDAAWSYVEWTLEFKNVATLAREARAQIALPPGGVVSRLTLWVNGEEREAAFAGRSQVREAYRQVVVVQKRDPVLVTSCGPDRVLMQCFPVPANGGTIKVRLGITAPLILENSEQAAMRWPCLLERNFSISQDIGHSLWIESQRPLQSAQSKLHQDQSRPGYFALHGQLTETELGEPLAAVRVRRDRAVDEAWVMDHGSSEGAFIRQLVKTKAVSRPDRAVFVIDGTHGMDEFYPQIADALAKLPDGMEFSLLLAKDGVAEISGTARKGDAAFYRDVAQRLRRAKAEGGQDNVPALVRAWDLAAGQGANVIVWIHGPQPVLLDNSEALRQRLDWSVATAESHGWLIYDVQTKVGPNRVLEKFDGLRSIIGVPRLGNVREDLETMFTNWRGDAKSLELVRERAAATDLPASKRGKESSKHLARLWAYDEVLRLMAARKTQEAIQVAGQYQLVTPVSGAVVLETAQQFAQAGLRPVDANSVPSVPEPAGLFLIVMLGGLGWIFVRRRHATARGA